MTHLASPVHADLATRRRAKGLPATSVRRTLLLALGAAITAIAWAAWVGRDTQYDIDPVTGASSGPNQPWQVVGLVATLFVLAVWFRAG
jgi:hypothetical protein